MIKYIPPRQLLSSNALGSRNVRMSAMRKLTTSSKAVCLGSKEHRCEITGVKFRAVC